MNFIQRWNHTLHEQGSLSKDLHYLFPSLNAVGHQIGGGISSRNLQPPNAATSSTESSSETSTEGASDTDIAASAPSSTLSSSQVTSPDVGHKAAAGSYALSIGATILSRAQARAHQPRNESIELPPEKLGYSDCTCQIIRSISEWSVGLPETEQSIYKAYLTFIKESEHFIYIENQYFISSIDLPAPKNRIAEALYRRYA